METGVRFPVGAWDTVGSGSVGQDGKAVHAGVAQLVERHVANVKVASSNLVARFG